MTSFTMYGLLREGMLREQLFKTYLLSYFAFRFLTEFIRPEIHWAFGLTAYQWAIVLLTPVFGWLLWSDRLRVANQ